MKRIILLATCGALFSQSSLLAQTQAYSYWSAKATVGLNRSQNVEAILSSDGYGFACGFELERTFNPLWGIAGGYTFLDYSVYRQRGVAHEITALTNLNLSNLVSTFRSENWQKFNVYSSIGVGLSFYHAGSSNNTTIVIPFGVSAEYALSPRISLSLNGERRWHTSRTMGFQDLGERAVLWSATVGLRFKFGSQQHIRNTPLDEYVGDL
ncbi:MAG: porin family protein [Prevotellaceae bacterium]|nr:porin family protein [Prevotellaceae bacterium]